MKWLETGLAAVRQVLCVVVFAISKLLGRVDVWPGELKGAVPASDRSQTTKFCRVAQVTRWGATTIVSYP